VERLYPDDRYNLWGRETWDQAVARGGARTFGIKVKNFVFSRTRPASPSLDAEFINEPVAEFAKRIRQAPGKNIWMMGGGGLIASFLDAGEIDGAGIPLIESGRRSVDLELRSADRFDDGVVRLHYRVATPAL